MTEESNKRASENQQLFLKMTMNMANKEPQKDLTENPMFVELFKKAVSPPPKTFVEESMPKVFDFVMSNNAKAMEKMMQMQIDLGQNDLFFQRMKAFQSMAESMVPHAKDLFVKLASIKAMKETKKEEFKKRKKRRKQKR